MKNTRVHRLIEEAEELRLDASSIETVRSQIPRYVEETRAAKKSNRIILAFLGFVAASVRE